MGRRSRSRKHAVVAIVCACCGEVYSEMLLFTDRTLTEKCDTCRRHCLNRRAGCVVKEELAR